MNQDTKQPQLNPVPETSNMCCGITSLWKSLMKLTLPSETQTSWFCCCWMVSFNAPYQPSFMLFMLMVAKGQWQEGRHYITQKRIQLSQVFLKTTFSFFIKSNYLNVCCTKHAALLYYVPMNSSKGGSLLDSFTLQLSELFALSHLHLWEAFIQSD